jgi:hypothetical protein
MFRGSPLIAPRARTPSGVYWKPLMIPASLQAADHPAPTDTRIIAHQYGHPRIGALTQTELAAARADLAAQTKAAS